MNLGNKKVRYAIVKKNGNMRQVTGAKLGSGNAVTYSKEAYYVNAENTSAEDATVLIKNAAENPTKASYIIKDSANNVYSWGWIENTGTTVTVPAHHTLYTDGIMAHDAYIEWSEGNIFTFKSGGVFKITEWNTSNLCQAFQWSQGKLIEVPNKWPVGVTNIESVCLNTNITNTPSFENLENCTKLNSLYQYCKSLTDINFTGYQNIKSGASFKQIFNETYLYKDISGSSSDLTFYDFYKLAWKNNSVVTDMYKDFLYITEDKDGTTRQCKPFCFAFIDDSAGGYLAEFKANSDFSNTLTPSHFKFDFSAAIPFAVLNNSKEYLDGTEKQWRLHTYNHVVYCSGLGQIFKYTSTDFDFAESGGNLPAGNFNMNIYSFRRTPGNESNVDPTFNDDGTLKNCGTHVLISFRNITFTVTETDDGSSITNKVVTNKTFTQNRDGTITIE